MLDKAVDLKEIITINFNYIIMIENNEFLELDYILTKIKITHSISMNVFMISVTTIELKNHIFLLESFDWSINCNHVGGFSMCIGSCHSHVCYTEI